MWKIKVTDDNVSLIVTAAVTNSKQIEKNVKRVVIGNSDRVNEMVEVYRGRELSDREIFYKLKQLEE